ncbi:hypothetical protein N431DRAFT_476834 [Stipitochalara longipes BDJ]|nr:hypothetical protein N431DRAFT_476834 [Stipitochalara longipes BDJ]
MANPAFDLGLLNGNSWRQYADTSGLISYHNSVTQVSTYGLPAGWEDAIGDIWVRNTTKTWPQWNNQRTGRARLDDPNPPPPATYLNNHHVAARISALESNPRSPEHLYRRMINGILQSIFTPEEGFSVMQEDSTANLQPDFTVLKLIARPGGSAYEYDYLIGETKAPGESWTTFEQHLQSACAPNVNDTKNIYGMLHIGFAIQFYKHENFQFQRIGDRMHLVDDVHNVIAWGEHIKANPMPFVNN